MANLVSKMKSDHVIPGQIYKKIKNNRSVMKELKLKMETSLKAIDAKEGKILTVEELGEIMDKRHYQQLIEGMNQVPIEKIIEYWLDLWFSPASPEMEYQDEDEQLAAALKNSLQVVPADKLPLEVVGGLIIEGVDDENELIDVLDEPQLLEEERILEGEAFEIPHFVKEKPVRKNEAKVTEGDNGWQVVQLDPNERKHRIKNGMRNNPFNTKRAGEVTDVWDLENLKERWRLYQYWLNGYIRACKGDLRSSANIYDRCAEDCRDIDQTVNALTLRNSDVVGVTTTGASKHSYIFKQMNPKIVIVEEAAEVLESHIVTSLCSSVQQLILIGDHKQLQPKITHYELEKTYNLQVSLFERLSMNGLPIATLAVQHRMRPEIASIVGTHIYEHLENHESVYEYEDILGVGRNMFFIDHHFPEKANPTGDVRSHANVFEALYVVSLTRYLLKQGYDRSQITILTMYRGQLFEIRQNMRKDEFDGVRVAAVDDFQGEENDIIMLSLVRSNDRGSIGFLKVENRLCVSLSRAKKGMFVIGNLSMLRDKSSTKWPEILGQLDRDGCVGHGLPLYCQNHPDEKFIATTPEDFSKCPEGGCQKKCNFRLECGHVCRSPCHPIDREHKRIYKCQQPCLKKLACGHDCIKRCFECLDGCPPCQVNVERKLPKCGHKVRMQCSEDHLSFVCRKRCDCIISCGHRCQNKCQEPCSRPTKCKEKVYKDIPCGHSVVVPCCISEPDFQCPVPCQKMLDCDHICTGTCGKCCEGRLHAACTKKCQRSLACSHLCSFPCTSNCPPCMKKCRNYCYHSQCPKMCYEPCPPCREPCEWNCPHYRCTAKCGEVCNRPRCNASCQKVLSCGHLCVGLCGEDCPLCGECHKKNVREIFFGTEDEDDAQFMKLKDCSHVFEVTGMDHWMDQKSKEESQLVKFIECPKCKTPIRRSLRYGNIIKQTIADMEKIKCLVLKAGSDVDASDLLQKADEVVLKIHHHFSELVAVSKNISEQIKEAIATTRRDVPPLFPHQVNTIENQLILIPHIARVFECLKSLPDICEFGEVQVCRSVLSGQAKSLTKFLKLDVHIYLTPSQISSAKCEVQRLLCLSQLCQIQAIIAREKKQLQLSDRKELIDQARFLVNCGRHTSPPISDEQQQEMDQLLKRLQKVYSIGGISIEEKAEIVKAMHDIMKGAWYKCPNGHLYAIGECGGATQMGICPECGTVIGGEGHRLVGDNTHAREMDNSHHAAWSEGANLANYDLQGLF